MTFETLGLHPQILQALTDAGYTIPTPVQQEAVPAAIAGRLEVRGLGIVRLDADQCQPAGARVVLAVDLVDASAVERLPEAAKRGWLGVDLPLLALDPRQASAPAKLRLAASLARQGTLFAH